MSSRTKKRKIALVGSRSVGKSSLLMQYVSNHFVDSYDPTIHNTVHKEMTYMGQSFSLELHDTAGQDDIAPISSSQYMNVDGWLLVYSIADLASFQFIKEAHKDICQVTGETSVPSILVGNKCDLHNDREVPLEMANKYSAEAHIPVCESSAKENVNVKEVMEQIVYQIEKKYGNVKENKSCSIS